MTGGVVWVGRPIRRALGRASARVGAWVRLLPVESKNDASLLPLPTFVARRPSFAPFLHFHKHNRRSNATAAGCEALQSVERFCGHGIGRAMHMQPMVMHFRNTDKFLLQPGMTFTVEPMITRGRQNCSILDDGTLHCGVFELLARLLHSSFFSLRPPNTGWLNIMLCVLCALLFFVLLCLGALFFGPLPDRAHLTGSWLAVGSVASRHRDRVDGRDG